MTAPQVGREMAAARAEELRRAAERHRTARIAAAAGREAEAPRAAAVRHARWYARLAGAALRH